MPKAKFELLSVTTGRGNKYVTFAHPKQHTEKGDGMIEQSHNLLRGTQNASGNWTFEMLIHKNGDFEWVNFDMFSYGDMEEWCAIQ